MTIATLGEACFNSSQTHTVSDEIRIPERIPDHSKRLDPAGDWWRSVLAATGQPERFV